MLEDERPDSSWKYTMNYFWMIRHWSLNFGTGVYKLVGGGGGVKFYLYRKVGEKKF